MSSYAKTIIQETLNRQPWIAPDYSATASAIERALLDAGFDLGHGHNRGRCREPEDRTMSDCVFCQKIEDGSVQREALRVYSFEPLNPVTRGHRLFIVETHFAFPHHDPMLASIAFAAAARHAGEQGGAYNLIVNAGDAASQTIPHVHVHYVPRERDDGLRLPWTDQEIRSQP